MHQLLVVLEGFGCFIIFPANVAAVDFAIVGRQVDSFLMNRHITFEREFSWANAALILLHRLRLQHMIGDEMLLQIFFKDSFKAALIAVHVLGVNLLVVFVNL